MAVRARQPGECVLCGASPTPHGFLYFDTAVSIFFDRPLRRSLKPLVMLLTPFVRWLTNVGTHGFFALSEVLGAAKFHDEPLTDEVSRKSVVFAEAKKRGIRMQVITFAGKEVPYARAMLPSYPGDPSLSWQYFEHIPIPPWREATLTRNLDNKSELKELFERHGVKVPRGKGCFFYGTALRTFRKLGVAVIVKPLEGSRSRHTRVNITTETELKEAFLSAKQLCPVAMIEEFAPGAIYRATCIGFKTIGVMELVRPKVIADGVQTMDEMRRAFNEKNLEKGVLPIEDDALFAFACEHQGYAKDAAPPAGTTILLAEFSERTSGGYFDDVTDAVPQKTIEYINNAAKVSGLPVVGFDVISRDITNADEPLTFLEANTAPFIEIHHIPYGGEPRNVAGAVWDEWFI